MWHILGLLSGMISFENEQQPSSEAKIKISLCFYNTVLFLNKKLELKGSLKIKFFFNYYETERVDNIACQCCLDNGN